MQRKTALITGSTSGIGLGIATEIEKLRASLEAEYVVAVRYQGAECPSKTKLKP